jgi:hypothetical protein
LPTAICTDEGMTAANVSWPFQAVIVDGKTVAGSCIFGDIQDHQIKKDTRADGIVTHRSPLTITMKGFR